MNEIANVISQVGFPIFVAVWMLYKSSNDSKAMNDTINDLRVAITELTTLIQNKERDENG